MNAARSDPPMPRVRVRAAQRREQERAARKKERRIRRRERREQRDEEYWLREQQGLSPLVTSEYSLLGEGEEEESDGGQAPLRGGSLRPLTKSRGGGRGASTWEAPTTRRSIEGAARVTEASGSAAVATRPPPQRPSSPRGRGSGASPP
jgi:hypothetical protein